MTFFIPHADGGYTDFFYGESGIFLSDYPFHFWKIYLYGSFQILSAISDNNNPVIFLYAYYKHLTYYYVICNPKVQSFW
jgi:hypothetical protein